MSVPELRRDAPSFHRHQYNVERRIPRRRQNDSTDSPDPDSSSSRADHCSGLLRARMHARPSPRCYAAGRLLGARYPGRIRGSGSRRSWECRRGRSSSEGRDDDGLKRPGTLQCRMPCAPSSSSAVRPPQQKREPSEELSLSGALLCLALVVVGCGDRANSSVGRIWTQAPAAPCRASLRPTPTPRLRAWEPGSAAVMRNSTRQGA